MSSALVAAFFAAVAAFAAFAALERRGVTLGGGGGSLEAKIENRWSRSAYDFLTQERGLGQQVLWKSMASASDATMRIG